MLPVGLVVSQYVTQRILSPPSNDPQQQQSQAILKFLPLMIGQSLFVHALCQLSLFHLRSVLQNIVGETFML